MVSLIAAAREPTTRPKSPACCRTGLRRKGCSRPPAKACRRAPSITQSFGAREGFEAELDAALRAFEVDLVACAGFMRLMSPGFVERWRDRMLNIHPSLLPAFKGLNTHARTLAAGVKI